MRIVCQDSHEISYFIFFRKLGKISQNLLSAAVVIGALRVNFLCSILSNVVLPKGLDYCTMQVL